MAKNQTSCREISTRGRGLPDLAAYCVVKRRVPVAASG